MYDSALQIITSFLKRIVVLWTILSFPDKKLGSDPLLKNIPASQLIHGSNVGTRISASHLQHCAVSMHYRLDTVG